ncbi:ACP S-malonyltransferase [Priestia megaterium]|uniref:ACP S-malonyltransferase n=1 Tax=Priestia megaterium TaxID=1404 RepID=UPI002E1DE8E2|nr:ACP S-malonyltransferase [Priestia megaterium]
MNKKVAVIFPGQGSQVMGMGKDLISLPLFAQRLEKVAELANLTLDEFFQPKNMKIIEKTEIVQPYIFVISVTLHELISKEYSLKPILFGGHSLGEFSALVASGMLSFEAGFELVKVRGSLMGEACNKTKGGMLAVLSPEKELFSLLHDEVKEQHNTIKIANYNSANQLVISGADESIKEFKNVIENKLKARAIPLKVSGAFHSGLMNEANKDFSHYLDFTKFQAPLAPIVMNVSGEAELNKSNIFSLIKEQMISSVLWKKSMETIESFQPDLVLEIGPGRVLSSLIKSSHRNLNVSNIGNRSDLLRFKKQLEREVEIVV